MSDNFFASTDLVWVEFKSGWKVALKSEMNAGDQDAIEKAMAVPGADGTLIGQPASLRLLELNIIKIINPEGKEIEIAQDTIRKLSKPIMAKLQSKILELNPFGVMAEEK